MQSGEAGAGSGLRLWGAGCEGRAWRSGVCANMGGTGRDIVTEKAGLLSKV